VNKTKIIKFNKLFTSEIINLHIYWISTVPGVLEASTL